MNGVTFVDNGNQCVATGPFLSSESVCAISLYSLFMLDASLESVRRCHIRRSIPQESRTVTSSLFRSSLRPGKRLLRRSLSLWRNGPVVLLYHRVSALRSDPQLLSITPELFGKHLDALASQFRIISVPELTKSIAEHAIEPGSVAITFDDRYADNLECAAPLLVERGIPATVFVSTGHLGTGGEMWWDRLERLVLRSRSLATELTIAIDGQVFNWNLPETAGTPVSPDWDVTDVRRANSREWVYAQLHAVLRRLNAESRRDAIEQIARCVNEPASDEMDTRLLSRRQVRTLAETDGITVGAHTVSHPSLAALDLIAQRDEIESAKSTLETLVDRPVELFSYPFGSKSDFSHDTIRMVKQANFSSAFANVPGHVHTKTDLFAIPRLATRPWTAHALIKRVSLLMKGIH